MTETECTATSEGLFVSDDGNVWKRVDGPPVKYTMKLGARPSLEAITARLRFKEAMDRYLSEGAAKGPKRHSTGPMPLDTPGL